jgi:hypothetical protein
MLEVNIISLLVSYAIEMVHLLTSTVCFSYLFVVAVGAWPLVVAQAWVLSFHALACIICALGAAIATLQLLYVTRYNVHNLVRKCKVIWL